MSAPVTLSSGPISAVVEPAFGGRVTAFRHAGTDLFAPVADNGSRDLAAPASCGCFPLVPWSNRIRDARLTLGGETVVLPVTEPSAGHAIHGHGLRRAWQAESDGATAHLHYAHAAGAEGWPWSYRAAQVIRVDDRGMTMILSVTNTADTAMPAGLGLHPYFPRTPGTRITLPVETAWPPVEAEKFPAAGGQPLPEGRDRWEARPVQLGLDQGFGGWAGTVRIAWPERGMALTMAGKGPLEHLIVYTPTHRDYFCVEPVTHAIDAANLAENQGVEGTGHRVLEPMEELSVSLTFMVEVI